MSLDTLQYSFYPVNTEHTRVMDSITRRDTQPTPRQPSSCTITQFTWCWPFRSPLHSPHIHNPLRAAITPVLRVLFRLQILSLTLRLWLGQCPVRDGWVHWIAYYGCQVQDTSWFDDVVDLWNGGIQPHTSNSEHSGSPDCGGSGQYSSTQAMLRTSDLSVCNPGPTAHLKNRMTRPTNVLRYLMTTKSFVSKGRATTHCQSHDSPRRTRTHHCWAVDNWCLASDQGLVLAWASKSGWRSHDRSKSCCGMLKKVAPKIEICTTLLFFLCGEFRYTTHVHKFPEDT